MDNSKIIDKLYEDNFNWDKKLSNLEEALLKKRENKYKDSSYQYEKEIEQAKIDGNVEKVEKKYESIEKELFYDYFYFNSMIHFDSKYKSLKDLLKWKKEYNDNFKKWEELESLFEDPIISHKSKTINLQQKINRTYAKCMRGKIELISIYKKVKIKRKIEKLSELFNKEIEQKNLTKKEKERIIEKYDKKMKEIQDCFFKDYARIIQTEEKINQKIENKKKKLSEKIKKHNEMYEKKDKDKNIN